MPFSSGCVARYRSKLEEKIWKLKLRRLKESVLLGERNFSDKINKRSGGNENRGGWKRKLLESPKEVRSERGRQKEILQFANCFNFFGSGSMKDCGKG